MIFFYGTFTKVAIGKLIRLNGKELSKIPGALIKAKSNSCGCAVRKNPKETSSVSPIITGVLIALIPKCPYCILAYSSAITMCSGSKIYMQSPGLMSYITLGLAFMTLLFILINHRGKRTYIAALFVGVGSLLMLACQFYTFNMTHYYTGTILIFLGVWFNASFRYFYVKWFKPLLQRASSTT